MSCLTVKNSSSCFQCHSREFVLEAHSWGPTGRNSRPKTDSGKKFLRMGLGQHAPSPVSTSYRGAPPACHCLFYRTTRDCIQYWITDFALKECRSWERKWHGHIDWVTRVSFVSWRSFILKLQCRRSSPRGTSSNFGRTAVAVINRTRLLQYIWNGATARTNVATVH